MLNSVVLMGRITRDLEIKESTTKAKYVRFTIAIDRPRDKNGDTIADFIECVAWDKRAEFICNYFGKGRMICLTGQLRVDNYKDRQGNSKQANYVLVQQVSFTGEK